MKARKHRGSFAESMATLKEIPATYQALCKYFNKTSGVLVICPYSFDSRQGWESNTWLVSDNDGVIGMISEEVIK